VKKIHLLPNLITLGNAFCGLLALAKGIDALAYAGADEALFYAKLETASWLIILAMVFDALDGKVARMTKSFSDFGAQLDSFADALTFGVAPALLAKVLLEHEGPLVGYPGHPRLHFLAAAAFSLMAILRLARFNLETEHDEESHTEFRGLPSPAAAGAVVGSMLMYLSLRSRDVEMSDGTLTPTGELLMRSGLEGTLPYAWFLAGIALSLPVFGLLMVSRVRYLHLFAQMANGRGNFFTLVLVIFGAFIFYSAPVPFLFVWFNGFAAFGLLGAGLARWRARGPVGGENGPAVRP